MENAITNLQNKIIANNGFVTEEDLIEYAKTLQKHKHHIHITIQGTNGSGKSYFMLYLMKLIDPDSIKNHQILYAYNTPVDLIDKVTKFKEKVIGCDEAKRFFDYKMHGTLESIYVQQAIEYARENRNIIITCAKDIRRLNNNYRDGQVQIIIWILDRFDTPLKTPKGNYIGYGAVFIGNPMLEDSDKFKLNVFNGATTIKEIKMICERLSPTFWGYILIRDVTDFLTPEEIEIYQKEKNKGILNFSEISKQRIIQKNKMIYSMNEDENNPLENNIVLYLKERIKKDNEKTKKGILESEKRSNLGNSSSDVKQKNNNNQ